MGAVTTGSTTPDPTARSRMVAAVFDRSALSYDSVGVPWFTPIADRLVTELAPASGERALDVGSGRGAALFPLARAVGSSGHVTGIDLSSGMVEALLKDVAALGLENVDVRLMDAADPVLEGQAFDLIASSLVLFFLPDPEAALRNWHRLLAPGGRIGISTFGRQDPVWAATDAAFTPYLPKQLLDARTSGASGPFGSDEAVEGLFTAAGFGDVRTVGLDLTTTFRDADQWLEWSWSHGQRAMWEAVPTDRHDEVRATATRTLQAARDETWAIRLGQRIRYTLGRRD
jgi:ubiquinone/menaquinone biosynthesis C-methylase UbiE